MLDIKIIQSILFGLVLTTVSYFVGLQAGWIENLNHLEALAVFANYMSAYLCVVQARSNYPIGIFATFLYSWFYWTGEPEPAKALAIFNLYLVFSLTYGYFRWGPDGKPLTVSRVKPVWWLGYVAIGSVVGALLWVATLYGAQITPLEATIFVIMGVAQFLLDNKKLETWAVWAVVNVLSIYFFWTQGWYLVMFQYLFLLCNTIWGWSEWARSHKETANAQTLSNSGIRY